MDELRRIRDLFGKYPSVSNSLTLTLFGMLQLAFAVLDTRAIPPGPGWVRIALSLGMLTGAGLLLWAVRSPQGRVIGGAAGGAGGAPTTRLGMVLGVLALVVFCGVSVMAFRVGFTPLIYQISLSSIAVIAVGNTAYQHRSMPTTLLYAAAIGLPMLAALGSQEWMLSYEAAWRVGVGLAIAGSGGFGPVALRAGLRPPSTRRAARMLADERAPQGLGSPDALPVLAALCGCAGASPLLLQRLSRGPVDAALAELAGAGLAVVENRSPDPRNAIARSTAAGRQAIEGMLG